MRIDVYIFYRRAVNDMDNQIELLIKEAKEARENAYCPYSKFKVGAALLTKDGKIFTGCNFENASFVAGSCAERTALGNAIVNGERQFKAIAICGGEAPCMPCGVCRQALIEFGDIDVYCVDAAGKTICQFRLTELLPGAFVEFQPE